MTPQEIITALSLLDPTNDDQWTADGQPRLGAVGSGVTRSQIQTAAPLFNRSNAVLPEQEVVPSPEELKVEAQNKFEEAKSKKLLAHQAVKDAEQAKAEAEAVLAKAKADYVKACDVEKSLDTRTQTQINMDYIKSQHEERVKKHQDKQQFLSMVVESNLNLSDVNVRTVSALDQAIAERNIRARKQANKGK